MPVNTLPRRARTLSIAPLQRIVQEAELKTARTHTGTGRKEQRFPAGKVIHALKPVGAVRCPRCRAVCLKGRWTWKAAPEGAGVQKCPACRRIEENLPAGYVTLKGLFLAQHRTEVLNLVAAREARARAEHPMQRIIGVESLAEGVLVTTTDSHLATAIAAAVHEAFKGELEVRFSPDENLVRATWSR